jgi:hypothetical protein
MFALAVLCSSVFIYNTKNVIDASALDGLHLAGKIATEFIQTNGDNQNDNNPDNNNPNENNPNENNPNENNPNENNPNENNPNENYPNENSPDENSPNENNPNENNPNENYPNENSPNENNPNENNPNDNLRDHFPILVWAIRDWFLDFEVPGKEDPSADEYMEHCLQKEGCKVIRDHFDDRKCFAFPPPVSNMRKMKDLGTIDEDELDEDFLEETKKLLSFIKQKAKSKKIYQEDINGKPFSELLKSLTKSILEKYISIKSTSEYVESATNRDVFEKAIENYKDMFEKEVSNYPGN